MDPAEIKTKYATHLKQIQTNLTNAQGLLHQLQTLHSRYTECQSLSDGWNCNYPMWPALPTSEQTTTRGDNHNREYVYLYWRKGQGANGPRPQPNGKRQTKTYIGIDTANIRLARQMVENRRQWMQLRDAIHKLQRQIYERTLELSKTDYSLTRNIDDATRTLTQVTARTGATGA